MPIFPQSDLFALARLREFVERIARLTAEGDVRRMGNKEYSEFTGEDLEAEEAAVLYSLIGEARELTGAAPDTLVDKATLEHCPACGTWYDKGAGCPICAPPERATDATPPDYSKPPSNCPYCHGEREWSGTPGMAMCHFCGRETRETIR